MSANGINEWERSVIYLYLSLKIPATRSEQQQTRTYNNKKHATNFNTMSERTSAYTSEYQIFPYAGQICYSVTAPLICINEIWGVLTDECTYG